MHRRQIPATGWNAIYRDDDGLYLLVPLVCWELICADPEDDDFEIRQDDNSETVHRDGSRTSTVDWHGTANKAIGMTFFELHPSRKPTRELEYVDEGSNFVGYLPPGQTYENWLKEAGLSEK